MKYLAGLLFAGGLLANGRECASLEECRASVEALKHQLLKMVEQNKTCAGELFNMKITNSLALPEDLKKKLDSFEKPQPSKPAETKEEK